MVKKLRVSLALQPVATALFANSPFTEGKPNGFLSFRSEIWRDTDNQRAGMLPWAFEDGMGFERYVDYALDVPRICCCAGPHRPPAGGSRPRGADRAARYRGTEGTAPSLVCTTRRAVRGSSRLPRAPRNRAAALPGW